MAAAEAAALVPVKEPTPTAWYNLNEMQLVYNKYLLNKIAFTI